MVRELDWPGIAHVLTWTLVHSVLVAACAALLWWALLRLVGERRARLRYAAGLAALACAPLAAAWTLGRELAGARAQIFIGTSAGASLPEQLGVQRLLDLCGLAAQGLRSTL